MLARIDPKKYQEKVSKTHAKYLETLAQYQRAAKLVKNRYISEAKYDAARANYQVVKANYGAAQQDIKDTYLRAPFNGVIAKKHVDNFEFVKAKETIAYLHNIQSVDVEIDVPENLMINFLREAEDRQNKHHPVALFNARPKQKYPLRFKEVTTQADAQTQTYRVVFTMKRPKNLNVLPGMNVNVAVKVPDFSSSNQQFHELPSAAVFMSEDKKPMVWIIDPKTMEVHKRVVTVSRLSKNNIQVLSGINAGDRVVTAGAHYLKQGQKVKLMEVSHSQ